MGANFIKNYKIWLLQKIVNFSVIHIKFEIENGEDLR